MSVQKSSLKSKSVLVIITAIMSIVVLELMAMYKGMNGVALASAIGGITFLAGGGTGYWLAKKE